MERKEEDPHKGYINLNKVMRPQKLFIRREFMKKVVEVAKLYELDFDDVVVTSQGRGSVTWVHPGLEEILVDRQPPREARQKEPSQKKEKKKKKKKSRHQLLAEQLLDEQHPQGQASAAHRPPSGTPPAPATTAVLRTKILSDWRERQQQRSQPHQGVLMPWQARRVLPGSLG